MTATTRAICRGQHESDRPIAIFDIDGALAEPLRGGGPHAAAWQPEHLRAQHLPETG